MGAPEMHELSFTDLELDFHVRNALKVAIQLVALIHHKERLAAEEVALLVTYLKAVTGAVSCIHIVHHHSLFAAASSNGEYVDLCLEMLVTNFMPPPEYSVDLLKQTRGLCKKTQVLDRVHSTFKNISNVVPLSPLRLEKIVRDKIDEIYGL